TAPACTTSCGPPTTRTPTARGRSRVRCSRRTSRTSPPTNARSSRARTRPSSTGSTERTTMSDVLAGIRVVEVADWGFVPSAATVLSDWGPEVVKIEPPRFGDPIPGLVTSGLIPGASGRNFFVEHLGRNKRSIGIDLGHPEGRALLDRLVARADVFLTSFLDDARERLRITWDDLRAVNPRLLYARGSGRGRRGPAARRGGYDGVSFWARGGVADRLSTPGQPPLQQRPAFGDFIGGMAIAGGIAAALFQRERTGTGV